MATPLIWIDTLRNCFSPQEWDWLQREMAFTAAIKSVATATDVERVCHLGENLIRLAAHAKEPRCASPPC
jgi:hypothetical protein